MKTSTFRTVFRLLREEGIWRTSRGVAHHLYEVYNDRKFGIHTLECISPEVLGIGNGDSRAYVPSRWSDFRRFMGQLPTIRSSDVFVDYGSGMGRVLIMAAAYSFARVVGVELSSQLSNLAKSNLDRAKSKLRCKNIEIFTCDAATFTFPDDATVVYFFNPFAGKTLCAVLANIAGSLQRAPRGISLICSVPSAQAEFVQLIQDCVWLRKRDEILAGEGRLGLIYENIAWTG